MIALSSLHTFKLPYYASRLITLSAISDIEAVRSKGDDRPFYLIGQGSNSVFVEDFEGDVLQVAFTGKQVTETDDAYVIKVGAGESWHDFVDWTVRQGMSGLENLALIPGTVGAAPIQNVGAYGVEVSRFISNVYVYDLSNLEEQCYTNEQCHFAYRHSVFKGPEAGKVVITAVEFVLPKAWQAETSYGPLQSIEAPTAKKIFEQVIAIRTAKLPDPKKIGNAGSFFKNPVICRTLYAQLLKGWPELPSYNESPSHVKVPAAWLIDRLGYKGKSFGGIQCHQNQPLVLTNTGNGTGPQLLALARDIRDSVKDTFGITLENEVRLIGKQGLIEL